MPKKMDLETLVAQIGREVDLEISTLKQYQRAAAKYSEFLGRTANAGDLTEDRVNAFLVDLQKKGRAAVTVRNYRVCLTMIWNVAVTRDLAKPYDRRRLRSPRIVRQPVRSWSLSQVKMLIDASPGVPGRTRIGHIPRGLLLRAAIRLLYDAGLRPVDQRLLRWQDVDLDQKTVTFVQHKTRRPHVARISDECVRFLEAIRKPTRDRIFPLGKPGMRLLELELFRLAARMGFHRLRGQGLGTLRKTHATQIYEAEGETAAAESLGHVGGTRTVRAHYIDSRSIRNGRLPPDLAG